MPKEPKDKNTNKNAKEKIDNKKPPGSTKNTKVIDIDKKEEEMLKGQIHVESHNINEQNSNPDETQKQENINNNNDNENNNEIKEKIKKEVIIKPRETYLKEKIHKNFSQSLISNINKSLDNQMTNIKTDIKDDKLLITKNIRNLNKLLPSSRTTDNLILTSDENYQLKNKMKQIKELKDQEKFLQNKLSILLSNEKFLNEKEIYNFSKKTNFFPGTTQGGASLERRLKLIEMEKIKQQKEELLYKLTKIKNKIKDIISYNDEEAKKLKVKNFLENFERDKEIIEIRAKKYYKESKEIQQRMKNDINSMVERKKKEMEEEEEKIKKQKNDYIEKFRNKEKEIEDKRLKDCKKRASLFQSFSFNKPKSKAEECLYNIKTEKYLRKEANYFRKEKNKRKILIKSMTKEELEDFSKSYDNYKDEYYKKSEEKQRELFLEWKKRKEQLPSFMSSFFEIADLESKRNQEMEKESKEKIEYLIQNKKDYSEKIKQENKPKISKHLKRKRLNDIFKRENPKLAVIQDSLLKRKKKKILSQSKSASKMKSILKNGKSKNKSKSKSKSKSSKSLQNIKNKNHIFTELNKSEIISQKLIRKPIKIKFVGPRASTDNKINIRNTDKKIDYLKKIYNNKTYKESKVNDNQSLLVDKNKNNKKKWDDILKEKNNTLLDNIEIIKRKADIIDREADKNEKILKLNGGIATNPKLGRKVSNLLLDSIQAKLSILNQIKKQI